MRYQAYSIVKVGLIIVGLSIADHATAEPTIDETRAFLKHMFEDQQIPQRRPASRFTPYTYKMSFDGSFVETYTRYEERGNMRGARLEKYRIDFGKIDRVMIFFNHDNEQERERRLATYGCEQLSVSARCFDEGGCGSYEIRDGIGRDHRSSGAAQFLRFNFCGDQRQSARRVANAIIHYAEQFNNTAVNFDDRMGPEPRDLEELGNAFD